MRLPRPRTRGVLVTASAAGAVAVAGAVVAVVHVTSSGTSGGGTPVNVTAGAPAQLVLDNLHNGRVPWSKPVRLHLDNGTFRDVAVTAADGDTIGGSVTDGGTTWISAETLVPLTHYQAKVDYLDLAKQKQTTTMSFVATDSAKHLTVTLSPGDGAVVGVGSPVIARFSRSVPKNQRAAVQARLAVATSPAVVGAWHWMSDQEVHWRPPTYWRAHTKVRLTSDLSGLYVGKGVWGTGKHHVAFKIGNSHISRVDVAAHQMYVYNNGALVRTMPISAGRDKYPTKSGVHITFEKSQVVTMDSATVGIPRNSPDGYYEKVYWDVRISYGGAFVHAAPWSVSEQGVVNVSHGCVNLSTANATWFYYFSDTGDIVDVYNSSAAPDTADPGMADWNMSWKDWLAGDAAPSPEALALKAKSPRYYEPGEPGFHSASTPGAVASSSASPSATPSSTASASASPAATPTASPTSTR